MTVIAAAIDRDGTIFMGADGMSVSGQYGARPGTHSKVFKVGEFLIGSCGTVNIGQSIALLLEPPPIEDDDLYRYMVTKFGPCLRDLMKARGGEIKNQSGQEELDGRVLVGVRGKLFFLDSGYGVIEPAYNFAACGCADQEALAAMFTAWNLQPELSAERVVACGLEAAAEFDLAIRPPFTFINSKETSLAAVA